MDDLERLHRLLYMALVGIREEGRDGRRNVVVGLADLFHTIPLQLDRVARGDIADSVVMRLLRERAVHLGCDRWVEDRLREMRGEDRSV